MVHAVPCALALSAIIVDRIIASHPVTYAGSAPEVLSANIVDPKGANVSKTLIIPAVIAPMVAAGVLVAGSYAAIHIVRALNRLALKKWWHRSCHASWFNGPRPLRSLGEAIFEPDVAFMPSGELPSLISACILASIASSCVSAWAYTVSRSSAQRGKGAGQSTIRIANAVAWSVAAFVVICALPPKVT